MVIISWAVISRLKLMSFIIQKEWVNVWRQLHPFQVSGPPKYESPTSYLRFWPRLHNGREGIKGGPLKEEGLGSLVGALDGHVVPHGQSCLKRLGPHWSLAS